MKTMTDEDDDRQTRQVLRVTDVDLDDEDNGKKKNLNKLRRSSCSQSSIEDVACLLAP